MLGLIKRFNLVLGLIFFSILLSSCGPSPEELTATSAAQTASAATSTPTKTPTSTPTPTFTPTPTLTPTPTPLPDPDSKAMLKWREVGFPVGIIAIPPRVRGVEEGAFAFNLIANDGSILEYYISGSFAFNDDIDNPSQMIYGYSVLLPSIKDREAFDDDILNYLSLSLSSGLGVPLSSVSDIPGSKSIGDQSAGVTTQYNRQGETWQFSWVAFRVDDIGAWVFMRNDASLPSPVNLEKVARVYADSIQRPVIPCKLTSVEADTTNDVPTFNFEAEGFYPNEGRMITLYGDLLLGDEIRSATSAKMGGGGESVGPDGQITDTIGFFTAEQLAAQGMAGAVLPPGPNEFTLNIMGFASGCEIEQTLTWSSEMGLAITPVPTSPPPETNSAEISIFRDDFNQQLEDGWEWLHETKDGWNLNKKPGFLRVEVGIDSKQVLVRNAPGGNFQITTRVLFTSNQNFQAAGLIILQDNRHLLHFHRGYAFFSGTECCIGNALYIDHIDYDLGIPEAGYEVDLLDPTKTDELHEAYLRLTREENTYTAFYSNDGENWIVIGKHQVNWVPVYVGIRTEGNQNSSPVDADFDFFILEVLP